MLCGLRWVQPPISSGETLEQSFSLVVMCLKISEDVFDEDDRRIDDNAEINRSHGEQICAFTEDYEEDDGEEQRKRNVQSNDDRAAEITEENPLDQEDQQASENQVVQNCVCGDVN